MTSKRNEKMDLTLSEGGGLHDGKAGAPAVEALSLIPQSSVWLANYVSGRTRLTYNRAIQEFVEFTGLKSEKEWPMVDQAHVIAWRHSMHKTGASSRTINTNLSALSSLFKHLCEKQAARRNPVTGVRRARVAQDRVETPVITPLQVRSILDAPNPETLKGLRDKALLSSLFYTGCRVAEVCSLKVKDFYEDAGYWVLDFTLKGGKKNRVAIHPELQEALRDYLNASGHAEEKDSPLLLAVQRSDLRRHLNSSQVNRVWHKYAKVAGLPEGTTPHTARATFITEALDNKCPIEAVQRSVGHSNISTTQMYDKRLLRHRESASFAVQY
jgi:site-specific recombinase XerD